MENLHLVSLIVNYSLDFSLDFSSIISVLYMKNLIMSPFTALVWKGHLDPSYAAVVIDSLYRAVTAGIDPNILVKAVRSIIETYHGSHYCPLPDCVIADMVKAQEELVSNKTAVVGRLLTPLAETLTNGTFVQTSYKLGLIKTYATASISDTTASFTNYKSVPEVFNSALNNFPVLTIKRDLLLHRVHDLYLTVDVNFSSLTQSECYQLLANLPSKEFLTENTPELLQFRSGQQPFDIFQNSMMRTTITGTVSKVLYQANEVVLFGGVGATLTCSGTVHPMFFIALYI